MTELRTPRLVLRRARRGDADALHAILSDPRAMRYWSTPPHEGRDETRDWLEAMIAAPREIGDDFIVTQDGQVIGKMGAWRLPEFGFLLAPDLWGKGLASEALAAFLGYVFGRPDVGFLKADVDLRNAASLALLERHGFTRTGFATATWNTHIGVCDSIYLTLARTRYRSSGQANFPARVPLQPPREV